LGVEFGCDEPDKRASRVSVTQGGFEDAIQPDVEQIVPEHEQQCDNNDCIDSLLDAVETTDSVQEHKEQTRNYLHCDNTRLLATVAYLLFPSTLQLIYKAKCLSPRAQRHEAFPQVILRMQSVPRIIGSRCTACARRERSPRSAAGIPARDITPPFTYIHKLSLTYILYLRYRQKVTHSSMRICSRNTTSSPAGTTIYNPFKKLIAESLWRTRSDRGSQDTDGETQSVLRYPS